MSTSTALLRDNSVSLPPMQSIIALISLLTKGSHHCKSFTPFTYHILLVLSVTHFMWFVCLNPPVDFWKNGFVQMLGSP
jgi:hypothetical protein